MLVDSDGHIRFERHLRRARDADVRSFSDFQKEDEKQAAFGALPRCDADCLGNNTKQWNLNLYRAKIDALVSTLPRHARVHEQKSELHRSLIALHALGDAGTCEQISAKSVSLGIPVRKYNTNRVLKSAPEFAERVKQSGHLLSYKLTARGEHLLDSWTCLTKLEHPRWHHTVRTARGNRTYKAYQRRAIILKRFGAQPGAAEKLIATSALVAFILPVPARLPGSRAVRQRYRSSPPQADIPPGTHWAISGSPVRSFGRFGNRLNASDH